MKVVRIINEADIEEHIEKVKVFRWFKSTNEPEVFEVTSLGVKWLDTRNVEYEVMEEKELDLDALREFYDPHPGLAGAVIPIPRQVKEVADSMEGQQLSLREAVERIQQVTGGIIDIPEGYDFISLRIGGVGVSHSWNVISYRDVEP